MDLFAEELDKLNDKEELERMKHRLFMEKVGIQSERAQLEKELAELVRMKKETAGERKQLSREKRQLSMEMGRLKEEVEFERKRLKEDERMLDKKQKLIEHSYSLLDADRKKISEDTRRLEREWSDLHRATANSRKKEVYATGLFFRGVNNQVALKKRYKELMKIYHPDNICGDQEILIKINEEYEELRYRFGNVGKEA
ncbi:MAG: hypothetical protein K5686_08685 [Lachnospiraceae bacterium]|nr:hypothetical protein [Lachnospiraceae bacterium]